MVDRTTGTTAFNLDLNNLVEDAFERCGQELRTGYDLRTARRSLNIMTAEWANRGINMWTIEPGQVTLNQGDRKSTRLNSSHSQQSRMPSSA